MLVAYPGAQGLDVFGPAEVFGTAARHKGPVPYDVRLASVGGGPIRATSGIPIMTEDLRRLKPRRSDTVLVVGGDDAAVRAALADQALVRWVARAARVAGRVGSVCSGAFVLAQAGVLDGRRAATHWSACARLAAFRPRVAVDAESIFVRDGHVWTSAGVTAGIDLALAMVEEDCGRAWSDRVAAQLVVYVRRPGFQSQFSEALVAQKAESDSLARALEKMRSGMSGRLDVRGFARAAGMSLRTLHRRCRAELGATPAKVLERVRVERARLLLGTTDLAAKQVSGRVGLDNPARLTRAFRRTLGVTPRDYAALFGAASRPRRATGGRPKTAASGRRGGGGGGPDRRRPTPGATRR
ncbi:MAG TPA: helix-turn-helix domain-containing protein [Polyangia bacterium]|nr:helix-turn-helix domain-containing protein [Polyangia bacterium]